MRRSNRCLTRFNGTRSSAARLRAVLIVTALLAACDSDSGPQRGPAAPAPAATPAPTLGPTPAPTPAFQQQTPGPDNPHAVSGQVFDAYSGGVADAVVRIAESSYSWSIGVRTDQDGQFIAYLPESQISVFVGKAGAPRPELVQPCAVQAEVRGSVDLQVEVMSSSTLQSLSPPRPQLARGATLTGTIFETIDGIRSPVTGAELWAEEYDDRAVATTLSDFQGGYFLCNLPPRIGLYVTKAEFRLAYVSITPAETPMVDIELQRR